MGVPPSERLSAQSIMSQTRSEIADLLARHRIVPRRGLGQHFLADPNIIRKIVELAGRPEGARALEIGVGTGTLTKALVGAGFPVTGYEVDQRFRPVLREVLGNLEVDMRFQDATDLDLGAFGEKQRWVLVANLPYSVGTPILLDLLRRAAGLRRFVVMLQSEVAERLTAGPGSRTYGLPSVVVGLYGEARLAFRVPPHVFVPPPNVDSAVVLIERTAAPGELRDLAVRLAAAGFGQRRKMLRTSLRSVIPGGVTDQLMKAGINPRLRAENVSPEGFLGIARVLDPAA